MYFVKVNLSKCAKNDVYAESEELEPYCDCVRWRILRGRMKQDEHEHMNWIYEIYERNSRAVLYKHNLRDKMLYFELVAV
jgi:hypothetical protein